MNIPVRKKIEYIELTGTFTGVSLLRFFFFSFVIKLTVFINLFNFRFRFFFALTCCLHFSQELKDRALVLSCDVKSVLSPMWLDLVGYWSVLVMTGRYVFTDLPLVPWQLASDVVGSEIVNSGAISSGLVGSWVMVSWMMSSWVMGSWMVGTTCKVLDSRFVGFCLETGRFLSGCGINSLSASRFNYNVYEIDRI